jgi:sec-independent protein translocase protein TatC
VAVTAPRRIRKDPEGRMPLREHLAELRRRLIRSGLAVVVGSVIGWYAYEWLFAKVQEPLKQIAAERHIAANINFTDLMQAFNLHLSMSVYLGIVLASPVWLYQLWAFVVPGLTRREKRHALAFSAVGAPLFAAGIWIGWLVLPNAVGFFATFAEPGTSLLPSATTYFGFVTRLLLAFGIAFLLPLFLVALNLAGVVSARTLAKGWRVAVFLVFLFAALASPTPDAGSMLALALPMCGLYALAVGFAALVDRRRARRGGAFGKLDDDRASPLEAAGSIESPTQVGHDGRDGDPTAGADVPRPDRFGDVT